MNAVWMRVRTELRAGWRAWLGLALAFALAGGLAMAAATGARRTATVYPRFFDAYRGAHVVTGGITFDDPVERAAAQTAIAHLPQVEAYASTQFIAEGFELPSGVPVTFPESFVLGDATGQALLHVGRAKVLRGRMFEPDAPDEAVIDLVAADRLGIGPGDRVTILLMDPESGASTIRRPVTIVGTVIAPGGVGAVGEAQLAAVNVTPGFMRANAPFLPPNEDGPYVRLRSVADIDAFTQAARKIAPTLDFPIIAPRQIAGVQKMMRYNVSALWILAALLAVAALAIIGQAIARQLAAEASMHRVMAALGTTRNQLIASDLIRAALAGVVGAALAVPIALAGSALTPYGIGRLIEPDPGVLADPFVLVIGALATFLAAVGAAVIPAIRLARRSAVRRPERPSRTVEMLRSLGAGPTAVAGARLALVPGRGMRTVPVRATIAGLALAIGSFAAASTFTASFRSLLEHPELYGFTWDVFAGSEDAALDAKVIAADPDIVESTPGGYGNISIAGKAFLPLVFEPGTIEPTVLAGRAPRADDEIALGTTLLRRLKRTVGQTVMVEAPESEGAPPTEFTIVGRVVVPPVFFQQVEPGESTAMTLAAFQKLAPSEGEDPTIPHLIRYRKGVDARAKVAELREKIPGLFVGQFREPGAELAALKRSTGLPIALTFVLLLMGIGTLVHTLITSIRKRRRDLAILKTLGFVSRQVRGTVAWQTSILVGVALLVGIPAGIVAGRWGWRLFADTIGVVPLPVSPVLLTVVILPLVGIALANIVGLLPGRNAARTSAATVLRTE